MAESFIVESEGRLYSWGWNEHGNLALEDKIDRDVPTMIEFGKLP
jgi:alpha-tubulin suppressor-like RCC1 family protein